jgi:hypothetical protein
MLSEIVKIAMLGTERSFPAKENLPTFLHEQYDRIFQSENNKEDKYLKISALFFQIHQTSAKANVFLEKINTAPDEQKKYISEKVNTMFRSYLKKDNKIMLIFSMKMFEKVEKIVHPIVVPHLLDMVYGKIEWRNTVANVCGNRANWLVEFNTRWKNILNQDDNLEKIAKKADKNKSDKETEEFLKYSKTEQYALVDTYNKSDMLFYNYLKMLLTEDFIRFPADFSMQIWVELQKRYGGQQPNFYHFLALHLHSSLKMEVMEQTNASHQSVGVHPNIAREMLEIMLDRDTIVSDC